MNLNEIIERLGSKLFVVGIPYQRRLSDFFINDKEIAIFEDNITTPIVIEKDGKQYNFEVDRGYRKIVLRITNESIL